MPSRQFVRASNHGLVAAQASATTLTGPLGTRNGFSIAALVTVTSLPGAAAYHAACSMQSATAAQEISLHLNGDSSGSVACKVGVNRVVPSTGVIPVADGRWYVIGAAKGSGTTTVRLWMVDLDSGVYTESLSAATFADYTAGTPTWNVGCRGASVDCWNGNISMATYGSGQIAIPNVRTKMANGAGWWYDHLKHCQRWPATQRTAFTDFRNLTNGPILNAQPFDSMFPTYPTAGTEPTWSALQPTGF